MNTECCDLNNCKGQPAVYIASQTTDPVSLCDEHSKMYDNLVVAGYNHKETIEELRKNEENSDSNS